MKILSHVTTSDQADPDTKLMSEMKPLEVCVLAEGKFKGSVVMRTASSWHFEVMDLNNLGVNQFWGLPSSKCVIVTPYTGESITLHFKTV